MLSQGPYAGHSLDHELVLKGSIVLRHDRKTWEEGFKAGASRVRIPARCPYGAGTTQAWSWYSGYIEGDAKRRGYSYSRGAFQTPLVRSHDRVEGKKTVCLAFVL